MSHFKFYSAEYYAIFPSIKPSVNAFMGTTSKMSVSVVLNHVDKYFTSTNNLSEKEKVDYSLLGADGVLRALYSVGFVGIYDKQRALLHKPISKGLFHNIILK